MVGLIVDIQVNGLSQNEVSQRCGLAGSLTSGLLFTRTSE